MNREMTLNVSSRQFNETFDRESREVYNYFKLKNNQAFFRQVVSTSAIASEMRKMFYSLEEDIDKGDILEYDEDTLYLVYNKEKTDNYYKSFLKRTNTMWNIHGMDIPFVSSVISSVGSKGSTIKLVNGIFSLTTTDNEYTRKIQINDIYYDLGGCWKVFNTYFVDGLCFIHFQRDLENTNMNKLVNYDGVVNLGDGKYKMLFYVSEDNNYFPKEKITYTSSNEDIATVNKDGIVTFIKSGTVDITALANGKTLTKTISDTNKKPEPEEPDNPDKPDVPEPPKDDKKREVTVVSTKYEFAIGGNYRPITANYIVDEVVQTPTEPIWTYQLLNADKVIEQEDATDLLDITNGTEVNKIKVKFLGKDSYANKYIRVTANYNGTKGYSDYAIKFL